MLYHCCCGCLNYNIGNISIFQTILNQIDSKYCEIHLNGSTQLEDESHNKFQIISINFKFQITSLKTRISSFCCKNNENSGTKIYQQKISYLHICTHAHCTMAVHKRRRIREIHPQKWVIFFIIKPESSCVCWTVI